MSRSQIINDIRTLAENTSIAKGEREEELELIDEALQEAIADLESEEEEEVCDGCGELLDECVCDDEDDEE